jgi:hypothetical protein
MENIQPAPKDVKKELPTKYTTIDIRIDII